MIKSGKILPRRLPGDNVIPRSPGGEPEGAGFLFLLDFIKVSVIKCRYQYHQGDNSYCMIFLKGITLESLAKLLKARGKGHSGQAKRDPESRIFKQFWIPAFAGMTE